MHYTTVYGIYRNWIYADFCWQAWGVDSYNQSMDKQFQRGQLVTANAFGGKLLSMIVVEDCGNVVLICKPEEFERAQREDRQPISVGFHKEDIRGGYGN